MIFKNLFFLFFLFSYNFASYELIALKNIFSLNKKNPLFLLYLGVNVISLLNKYRKQYLMHRDNEYEVLQLKAFGAEDKYFKEDGKIEELNKKFNKKNFLFYPAILFNDIFNRYLNFLLKYKSGTTFVISTAFLIKAANKKMRGGQANIWDLVGIFGPQVFNISPFNYLFNEFDFKEIKADVKEKIYEIKNSLFEKFKDSNYKIKKENKFLSNNANIGENEKNKSKLFAAKNDERISLIEDKNKSYSVSFSPYNHFEKDQRDKKLLKNHDNTPLSLDFKLDNPIFNSVEDEKFKDLEFSFDIHRYQFEFNGIRYLNILRLHKKEINLSGVNINNEEFYVFFDGNEPFRLKFSNKDFIFYEGDFYYQKEKDNFNLFFYEINENVKSFYSIEYKNVDGYSFKELKKNDKLKTIAIFDLYQKEIILNYENCNLNGKIYFNNEKYYYVNFSDNINYKKESQIGYQFIQVEKIEENNEFIIYSTVFNEVPYFFVSIHGKLISFAVIENEEEGYNIFLIEENLGEGKRFDLSMSLNYLKQFVLKGENEINDPNKKIIFNFFKKFNEDLKIKGIDFFDNVYELNEEKKLKNKGLENNEKNYDYERLFNVAKTMFFFGSKIANTISSFKSGNNLQAVVSGYDVLRNIINISKSFFKKEDRPGNNQQKNNNNQQQFQQQ
jgi:hypothetical protein